MPRRTAAASSSSISRVARLVPEVEAAGFVLACCTAAAVTSGLGDSSTPMGDGETVVTGWGESGGAGITVTTADGEGRRDLLGEGDGLGLGLGLGAADRVGVGRGGMTPVGELDGSALVVLLGDGRGLALAVAVAFGDGDGAGAAAAVDPSRTAGVSTAAARPRSSDRRTSGTRRL
jgi:hypothetical protein